MILGPSQGGRHHLGVTKLVERLTFGGVLVDPGDQILQGVVGKLSLNVPLMLEVDVTLHTHPPKNNRQRHPVADTR